MQTPLPTLGFASHPSLALLSGGVSLLGQIWTLAPAPLSFALAVAYALGRKGLGCSSTDPRFSQFPAWQSLICLHPGVPMGRSAARGYGLWRLDFRQCDCCSGRRVLGTRLVCTHLLRGEQEERDGEGLGAKSGLGSHQLSG